MERTLRREFLGQERKDVDGKLEWVAGKDAIWTDKPVSEIDRKTVIARLDVIKRRSGKHAARHALGSIRKIFSWIAEGERYGVERDDNPCIGISDKTIEGFEQDTVSGVSARCRTRNCGTLGCRAKH